MAKGTLERLREMVAAKRKPCGCRDVAAIAQASAEIVRQAEGR